MKTLIIIAAPPACGKTYVSERLAQALGNTVLLDKDDLGELVRCAFALAGEDADMDGEFYSRNLRKAEYSTVLNLAFSTLRFADRVILNAPLSREIRDTGYMQELKRRAAALQARIIFIWVSAPIDICRERMEKRNSDRDTKKLENWSEYVKKINYSPPYELYEAAAVDEFIVFDTKDDKSFNDSFENTLKLIDRS